MHYINTSIWCVSVLAKGKGSGATDQTCLPKYTVRYVILNLLPGKKHICLVMSYFPWIEKPWTLIINSWPSSCATRSRSSSISRGPPVETLLDLGALMDKKNAWAWIGFRCFFIFLTGNPWFGESIGNIWYIIWYMGILFISVRPLKQVQVEMFQIAHFFWIGGGTRGRASFSWWKSIILSSAALALHVVLLAYNYTYVQRLMKAGFELETWRCLSDST